MEFAAPHKEPAIKIPPFLDGLLHQLATVQQNLAVAAACLDRAAVSKRDLRGLIDLVHRLAKITSAITDCKGRFAGKFAPELKKFQPENGPKCSDDPDWEALLHSSGCPSFSGASPAEERWLLDDCFLRFLIQSSGKFRLLLKHWYLSSETILQLAKAYEALRCISLETKDTSDRLVRNIRGLSREIKSGLRWPEHALRRCQSWSKPSFPCHPKNVSPEDCPTLPD